MHLPFFRARYTQLYSIVPGTMLQGSPRAILLCNSQSRNCSSLREPLCCCFVIRPQEAKSNVTASAYCDWPGGWAIKYHSKVQQGCFSKVTVDSVLARDVDASDRSSRNDLHGYRACADRPQGLNERPGEEFQSALLQPSLKSNQGLAAFGRISSHGSESLPLDGCEFRSSFFRPPTPHVGSIDVDLALNHRNLREAG